MKYSKKNRIAQDKYYTNNSNATLCWDVMKKWINHFNITDFTVLEPAAGSGNMMNVVDAPVVGYDLFPERDDITRNDWLDNNNVNYLAGNEKVVMFTNPPFGKKGVFCNEFSKSVSDCELIGLIVPTKGICYLEQKDHFLEVIHLDDSEFELAGKPHEVMCSFVVMSKYHTGGCEIKEREFDDVDYKLELSVKDFQAYFIRLYVQRLKDEYNI